MLLESKRGERLYIAPTLSSTGSLRKHDRCITSFCNTFSLPLPLPLRYHSDTTSNLCRRKTEGRPKEVDSIAYKQDSISIYTREYHHINKEPRRLLFEVLKMAATYSPTNAVPSALLSLTTLFGMGRGGTSAL